MNKIPTHALEIKAHFKYFFLFMIEFIINSSEFFMEEKSPSRPLPSRHFNDARRIYTKTVKPLKTWIGPFVVKRRGDFMGWVGVEGIYLWVRILNT